MPTAQRQLAAASIPPESIVVNARDFVPTQLTIREPSQKRVEKECRRLAKLGPGARVYNLVAFQPACGQGVSSPQRPIRDLPIYETAVELDGLRPDAADPTPRPRSEAPTQCFSS